MKSPFGAPELRSFFLGGFECATHRRRDGKRVDVIARTDHDGQCATDYRLLHEVGIHTVRDGLRWHLIEVQPGVYDWSSLLPTLDTALHTGTQVIWDLCHWGVPEDLDPFSEAFGERFAHFAAAAARFWRADAAGQTAPTLLCPVNEISFWSWVGGDEEHFFPYRKAQGAALKHSLVRAAIWAAKAIREVDPSARFIQPEPIIQVSPDRRKPEDREFTARYTEAQYEVWDMLAGQREPQLGGDASLLDVIGVNYYWNNQWIHKGDRTPLGDPQHRSLHRQLLALWERYGRPILITETGAEGEAAAGWLGYVAAEVRQALRDGVPILGVCLYPVMDYPGWDDDRHCRCGVIALSDDWTKRSLHEDLVAELAVQQGVFAEDHGLFKGGELGEPSEMDVQRAPETVAGR